MHWRQGVPDVYNGRPAGIIAVARDGYLWHKWQTAN